MNSIRNNKRRGVGSRSVAMLAAAALATSPLFAGDPVPAMSPGAGGGGAGTTGTLPATYGTPGLPPSDGITPLVGDLQPAVTLRGGVAELEQIIASTHTPNGEGWHRILPAPDGTVVVQYYGNVQIDLDYAGFAKGRSSVSLAVNPAFQGGVAVVEVGGVRRASQVLRTGAQNLQLQRLASAGLLDLGVEVQIKPTPASRTTSAVKLSKVGNLLRIEQIQ